MEIEGGLKEKQRRTARQLTLLECIQVISFAHKQEAFRRSKAAICQKMEQKNLAQNLVFRCN